MNTLKYTVTADVLAGAGGRALGSVITKFRQFKNTGFKSYTKLFETCVSPVIEYAAEVWGFKVQVKSERVQQRAARYYLGVHPKTPIPALTGDMGWKCTQQKRYSKMIKYWNRLVKMNDNRLTKQVFIADKNLCKANWSSEVRSLCIDTGINPTFDTIQINELEFETKMSEQFNVKWKESLKTKPKLRTYVTFKETLKTEQYTQFCKSRRKRSLLAQFRMGILPIAIETGRFKSEPIEERICKLCDINAVEDEMHMLCLCDLYSDTRHIMYNNVTQRCDNFNNLNVVDKFVYLMSNEFKEVANFLDKAWDIRTKKLYVNK